MLDGRVIEEAWLFISIIKISLLEYQVGKEVTQLHGSDAYGCACDYVRQPMSVVADA
jgi:hypothetical protein